MKEAIKKLTIKDLQYLGILAQKWNDECPAYWRAIQRFSRLEQLNRKSYNVQALDFSGLTATELDDALVASLTSESIFDRPQTARLAGFFRAATDEIERIIFANNG